tara:strand:+ start:2169 stop:2918 length:750 start_codon:yes stop_codon:yes gene_type:complete
MDPDAAAYIAAVEAADTQALEQGTKIAIDNFVLGCKEDGIWTAIKASCILAGARTLSGALVPLAGTAPTNFNFVSGDYNRKTGLAGDGSTKYLNSNRPNAADPQSSRHQAIFVTIGESTALTAVYIGGGGNGFTAIAKSSTNVLTAFSSSTATSVDIADQGNTTGFKGTNRSVSNQASLRSGGSTATGSTTSNAENTTRTIAVFAQNFTTVSFYNNARLAFYSIGESLNLALLDARVTDLINAFAAAIP